MYIYIQYIFQSENKCLASSVDITGDTRFLTGTIIFCARSTTVPPRVIIIQRQPRQESMLYDPVFRATATDYGYIGRSFAAVIQGFLPRFLANRRFSAVPGVDRQPDSMFILAIKFCYRAWSPSSPSVRVISFFPEKYNEDNILVVLFLCNGLCYFTEEIPCDDLKKFVVENRFN